jgi:DNA-binding NarL/FixJ family response regulator
MRGLFSSGVGDIAMNELAARNDYRIDGGLGYAAFGLRPEPVQRVCLISRTPASRLGLPEAASFGNMFIEQAEDLVSAVRLLASRRSGCSLVLVNFDDFSGESLVIDLLRRLRTRSPNLPVILLSRYFRADDLSQERLAIADVSLVAPVTDFARIGPALEAAAANNAAWRKRRRSLMLEKARQMH